jgi:hypothetical protein
MLEGTPSFISTMGSLQVAVLEVETGPARAAIERLTPVVENIPRDCPLAQLSVRRALLVAPRSVDDHLMRANGSGNRRLMQRRSAREQRPHAK